MAPRKALMSGRVTFRAGFLELGNQVGFFIIERFAHPVARRFGLFSHDVLLVGIQLGPALVLIMGMAQA